MKLLPVALVLCFVSCCGQPAIAQDATTAAPSSEIAPPAHPATADQIREYFQLTHSVENAHKLMGSMLKSARATSAPYYTTSFWDDMEKAVMEVDLVGPAIPAYQKYFSEEDMAATIAFYRSPAGKRLLEAQPYISSVLQDVLRKAGEEAGRAVGQKHAAEIQELQQKQKSTPSIVLPPN